MLLNFHSSCLLCHIADYDKRWHVFTAIGGYAAVAIVDLVTTGKVHEDPTNDLAWPIGPAARAIESLKTSKKQD